MAWLVCLLSLCAFKVLVCLFVCCFNLGLSLWVL